MKEALKTIVAASVIIAIYEYIIPCDTMKKQLKIASGLVLLATMFEAIMSLL